MIIEKLKQRLCGDLLSDVLTEEGRSIAITSLWLPNGDAVALYFGEVEGRSVVSDEGATIDFLLQQQIAITEDRRTTIERMCRAHDVIFTGSRLLRAFSEESLGESCLELCQAITRASSIYYQASERIRSPLPVAVAELLRKRVRKQRGISRHWVDRAHDPKGSFPVDFHVNGIGQPRNLFTVASPSKSVMVSAVVHFLKSHGLDIPTMTIVDPEAGLGNRDIDRISLASTEIRFGLDKHENDVVEFALSGMPDRRK